MSKIDVLLGLQWGDEGKGKIVDVLTPKYDIIARFQGGPNAGHTLEFDGIKHILHIIPSGIFHKDKDNLIGNGVLVEPVIFKQEIDSLESKGINAKQNLLISSKAHLILPTHRLIDAVNESHKGKDKIGSTLKGIGPAYTDKVARTAMRIGDIVGQHCMEIYNKLKENHIRYIKSFGFDEQTFKIDDLSLTEYEQKWFNSLETLKQFHIIESEYYINEALNSGKRVLAEGAQGSMLDVDFGSYPFVTSSNTITAGVCTGLGVAPSRIGNVYGICKAYCTRVGSGPFPTELFDIDGNLLRENGREYGSTTGRPRRCGWIDLPALRYTCMLNGVTHLIIMKIDVMNCFSHIKMCDNYEIDEKITDKVPYDIVTANIKPVYSSYKGWQQDISEIQTYEQLPEEMKIYLQAIENKLGVKIAIISISPDRKNTIYKETI
ncbi:MAG: adenylosuccinate synthase [Bacteroidales bacterium]|jgi:adenylosuccinate synthase|nr:adenylosuccinate synthase [Bacteroidales bacterium]